MNHATILSNQILHTAIEQNASDIHYIPKESKIDIYFRVIGKRQFFKQLSLQAYTTILAYYKFISNMDIGETRKPQQGAISISYKNQKFSLRLSSLPTNTTESLVIRILPQKKIQQLEELFLFPKQIQQINKWLKYRAGVILLTGPTGSGKTTTLYAMVKSLMKDRKYQIITLEDPIEKELNDVIQVPINESTGITYDDGLKAALRHDPDILLVGEIRDKKTAEFVFRAAYTGHLVLSTLHAKDTLGTIQRLIDMEIQPMDLKQSLLAVASVQLIPLHVWKYRENRAAILELLAGNALTTTIDQKGIKMNIYDFQKLKRKAFAYGFIHQSFLF
ncbi:competence type IV pilus ATPase ComGA [Gracilibacillus dipsosauri]|uniref:Competence protein n=1 Tax=Gracilibacillus dipsosauri TaxID=178340 RepID=A0A317KYB8_9BACI|nr:competence type IV pilus ATPase ComGA [Gracilibacillus dipsosauri]PWU68532.1 competence protein [Gracilibacillus dipsosauri]